MNSSQGTFYLLAAVACAALAAGIAYLLTPLVQQAALRHGAAHAPRARDIHQEPVPRWGGVAVYLAFLKPWKDTPEHIDEVVEHARRFLKVHEPVSSSGALRPAVDRRDGDP